MARNATGAKRVKPDSAAKGVFKKLNNMLFGTVNEKSKAAGKAAADGLINMHKKKGKR